MATTSLTFRSSMPQLREVKEPQPSYRPISSTSSGVTSFVFTSSRYNRINTNNIIDIGTGRARVQPQSSRQGLKLPSKLLRAHAGSAQSLTTLTRSPPGFIPLPSMINLLTPSDPTPSPTSPVAPLKVQSSNQRASNGKHRSDKPNTPLSPTKNSPGSYNNTTVGKTSPVRDLNDEPPESYTLTGLTPCNTPLPEPTPLEPPPLGDE